LLKLFKLDKTDLVHKLCSYQVNESYYIIILVHGLYFSWLLSKSKNLNSYLWGAAHQIFYQNLSNLSNLQICTLNHSWGTKFSIFQQDRLFIFFARTWPIETTQEMLRLFAFDFSRHRLSDPDWNLQHISCIMCGGCCKTAISRVSSEAEISTTHHRHIMQFWILPLRQDNWSACLWRANILKTQILETFKKSFPAFSIRIILKAPE